MFGESGLASWLTALTKNRRPSARRRREASPGESPPGCVCAFTTAAPRRDSSADLMASGSSSQWTRRPSARAALDEDTPAPLQVVVDALLDGVAHLVRERHHEVLVVGGVRRMDLHMHRRMELDPPFARQRDHAQRSKPWPERRQW